jgi:amidase
VPTEDGETVVSLKRAGCVVIGKTNTPEFAAGGNTVNRVFRATRNPWDLRMSASGSTGGVAASRPGWSLAEGLTSAGACGRRRRSAASSACGPPRGSWRGTR